MAKEETEKQTEVILLDPYRITDWQQVPDIDDIIDLEQFTPPVLKALEHIGEPFALWDYRIMEGDMGEYMMLTVTDPATDETVLISTGSHFVMKAVKIVVDNYEMPVMFTFEKMGRSYKLATAKS